MEVKIQENSNRIGISSMVMKTGRRCVLFVFLGIFVCQCSFERKNLAKSQAQVKEASEQSPSYKIVFLGDSLTEGYGVEKSEAYPALVEKKLKGLSKNIKVFNSGVSGSTTASAVERTQWVLQSRPDMIVLALGANDGLRGVSIQASESNLSEAIELIQKNKRKITILLAGMLLPVNYGEKYRKQFAQMYPRLAKKHKVELLPFLLEGVGGVVSMNQPDGIHPNALGHQKIAETVSSVILELL